MTAGLGEGARYIGFRFPLEMALTNRQRVAESGWWLQSRDRSALVRSWPAPDWNGIIDTIIIALILQCSRGRIDCKAILLQNYFMAGRPTKKPEDRKVDQLRIPLTAAQKELIKVAAERAEVDMTAWARNILLKAAARTTSD